MPGRKWADISPCLLVASGALLAAAAAADPRIPLVEQQVERKHLEALSAVEKALKEDPDAARRLGTRDLSGCTLYSTSSPCRMCETAAYWANVARMYFGAGIVDGGRPRYDGC